MNWATAIPLVTLLGVVFMGGVAWAQLGNVQRRITEVRDEMRTSAKDQGTRIGEVETNVGGLLKWQAEIKGAEQRERDLSGVVRR